MKRARLPWWVSLFVLVVVGVIAGGIWLYTVQEREMRWAIEERLQSILHLKVGQINHWRQDFLADAADIVDMPLLWESFPGQLEGQNLPLLQRVYLSNFKDHHQYADILLVDRRGIVRISLSGNAEALPEPVAQVVSDVLHGTPQALTDLYINPANSRPQIAAVAALWPVDGSGLPTGAVVIQADARQFLYPLIETWPVPTLTAETLLVQRDGDDVLYLNELLRRKDTTLNLHIPLTQTNTPAVMAVLGYEGIVEGIDYSGVPVIAAIKAVPNSPWYMVSKEDRSEALAAWQDRSRLILVTFSGLVMAVIATFMALDQRNSKAHYRSLLRLQTEKQESESRFTTTVMSIGDGVIATDEASLVELMNPVAETLTGWTQEQARRRQLAEVFQIVNEKTRQPIDNPVAAVLQQRTIISLANHTVLISKTGQEYPIADSGAPIRDAQGHVTGAVLVFRDQTAERAVLRNLRESEERYRLISQVATDYIFKLSIDERGNIHMDYASENFDRITGRSIAEAKTPNMWGNIIHPEDMPRVQQTLQQVVSTGEPNSLECRYLVRGEMSWVNVFANPQKDEATGRVTGIIGAVKDISARKQAEEALRQKTDELDRYFTSTLDLLCIADMDGFFHRLNPQWESDLGYRPEELEGRRLVEFLHPEDVDITLLAISKLAQQEPLLNFTNRFRHKNGSYRWIEWRSFPAGEMIYSTARDITERKKAEDALQKLRRQDEEALRIAQMGHWEYDVDTGQFIFNDQYYTMHGITAQDVGGYKMSARVFARQYIHPDDAHVIGEAIQQAIETRDPKFQFRTEGRILRADKQVRDVTVWFRVEKDAQDRTVRLYGVNQDITERKQAARDLQISEEKFRSIFENSTAGVAVVGLDGYYLMVNPAFSQIFGYSADQFVDIDFFQLTHPDDVEVSRLAMQEVLNGRGKSVLFTKRYIHKDGHTIWAEASSALMYNADGTPLCYITHVNDITVRKQAEEEIRNLNEELEKRVQERTARLEAANQELEAFTYSVSHDLRAPLRAIDGYVKILMEDYGHLLDAEGLRIGSVISENALRMAGLIDDLLMISRLNRVELVTGPVDMRAMALAIYEELATPETRQRITFNIGDLPQAEGDPTFLRQVWVNLLSNAIKFSGKREHPMIDISAEVRPEEIIYSVRDNGAGFDMAYADKLFGVFQRLHNAREFEGTGIGLTIVKRLITRHGGRVWAEGKPDQGATFSFAIPHKV